MLKPNTPYGTRYGFTSRQQYLDFVDKQPRVLPVVPARPADSLAYRLAIRALGLVAALLVVCELALLFLAFGEKPPKWVRPELTPAQRAKAFRIPHTQK